MIGHQFFVFRKGGGFFAFQGTRSPVNRHHIPLVRKQAAIDTLAQNQLFVNLLWRNEEEQYVFDAQDSSTSVLFHLSGSRHRSAPDLANIADNSFSLQLRRHCPFDTGNLDHGLGG